ncbi:MAG TPA: CPBP family intramembrane glutamic endopeptidase [Cyclobacteriaceae bacterium]|nr:CPBP family intramembrane glutamic endopeptidase [Cyclobacteriaceae bacterium]
MDRILKNDLWNGKVSPWYSLLFITIIVLIGLFLGQAIGVIITLLMTNLSLEEIPSLISEPYTREKLFPIYLLQGFGTLGGFILSGAIYLRYFERLHPLVLFKKMTLTGVALTFLTVSACMMANSVLIDWNAHIHFPESLSHFETWARQKEYDMKTVTEFLTRFNGIAEFLAGMVIIAILPAVGEEYLFRGIIQNKLELILKNSHGAIWFTAILFSAFHFQFFGFIPRMMLGVLFGYIYYWSRNLWLPVIAHFLNNGFTLTMIYLYHEGIVKTNIEEENSMPWRFALVFGILGIVSLFYCRQHFMLKRDEPVRG